jgi:hypothetical protein
MKSKLIAAALFASGVIVPVLVTDAYAGTIAEENKKSGLPGGWPVSRDGTAKGTGQVDIYPGQWSIKTGDPVRLKISSAAGYDVRVMRVGWYGGQGATEIVRKTGLPAGSQPYVAAEHVHGMVEAKWSDTVTIPTDASWTPGLYVARVEQSGGAQATTFFVIRDDGRERMPFVFVLATATHQAYNTWPGPERGGKSLYGFNSSEEIADDSAGPSGTFNQAVKVSSDRPYFVGAGTGDVGTWETPMLRFLEKSGWDIAYATDEDLDRNPDYFRGRKAVLFAGHSEYWSRPMFDNALSLRDSGVNLLFATGNTALWQVRFAAGVGGESSTMVCYKTSWRNDPENDAAFRALNKGDIEEAKKHFGLVTRLWKNLGYKPEHGIDERRPGMLLTGVETAAAFSYWYPWPDYVVREPTHWIYEGTGLKRDDRIRGVMGYEIDSTKFGDPEFDRYRPKGQLRLSTMIDKDGKSWGSSGYYQAPSGAEVIGLGAIAFSWALDSFASNDPAAVDARAQRMITNVLTRWSNGTPKPFDPDAGTTGDGGVSTMTDADPQTGGSGNADTTDSGSGCAIGGSGAANLLAPLIALLASLGALRRRQRRPRTTVFERSRP